MRFAMSVSSSRVMNMTPLADPGRCRTITRPDTVMRDPSFAARSAPHGLISRACKCAPKESKRMGPQGQTLRAVIFDDLAPARHGGKRDFFLDLLRHNLLRSLFRRLEERQRLVSQPFDGPRSLST